MNTAAPRMTLRAAIVGTRLPIQMDIGFGDVASACYPPQTIVAEQVQAVH
jgi:hypothetical protein